MNKAIEMRQFVLYMMYVWMFSLLLAIIVYTIDSYRLDADNGLRACFLDCKFIKKLTFDILIEFEYTSHLL